MNNTCRTTMAAVLALLAPCPAVAAEAQASPNIAHESLTCVPLPGQNTKLAANLTLTGPVASARGYFRALDKKDVPYSYIELRHGEGGDFWGVLPKAEESTRSVEYRIVATDADGKEYSTDLVKVPVTKSCSVPLNDDERKYASNLVIGLTDDKRQDARPDGFLCDGIVSKITADGVLLPAEPCPNPAALLIGAAAAGALGGAVLLSGPGPGKPVSPSRPIPPPR